MTLLEVCVDSIGALQRAQARGARRIELCSRLDVGGLSPSAGLLELALAQSTLPLHVMVRPRAGDFCITTEELARMRSEIGQLKARKVAGVVFGLLRPDHTVDADATAELVRAARPLRVTFHRAFDETPDKLAALDALIALGCERVLTSGGAPTAHEGRFELRKLVERARGRIVVLAGGGVREHNWRELVRDSGVTEIHSSTPFAP
ncbi:MAG: copper homeostasis protein CutC [Planctomycetes bacterium]|nr:copper homeostasis protein CutC [Planctomycetota bacterium]